MLYSEFSALLATSQEPVVLLEGTRELPDADAPALTALASSLARAFPNARFRSGNAKGSDEAFAAGVAAVDPARLELVVPHPGHRSAQRPGGSVAIALGDVPDERMQDVLDATLAASPQYQRVTVNYREKRTHPRQRASAQLILRDTLKVTGSETSPAPVAGIFYVNAADPDRGGTGHTMRVCRARGIPVISQSQWMQWPM